MQMTARQLAVKNDLQQHYIHSSFIPYSVNT